MRKLNKTDKTTGRFIRIHKIVEIVCPCKTKFETTQDRLDANRGKFCSKKCMYRFRNPPSIDPNAGYSAIHKWVADKFGQPMKCEWCGFETNNKYQIHWANLTNKYLRDRIDWARLCAKCHWHYDREGINASVISR